MAFFVQSLSLKSIPKVLLSVVEKSLLLFSSNPFLTAEFPTRKHKASKPLFSQSLKVSMPLQNKETEATITTVILISVICFCACHPNGNERGKNNGHTSFEI